MKIQLAIFMAIALCSVSKQAFAQGSISGSTSLCSVYSAEYTVQGSAATTGFTWSVTNGQVASGQGTNRATMTFFGPAIGRTVSVTGNGISATTYVNVYTTSTPSISGPTTVCKGGTATYSVTPMTMPWMDRLEFFAPGATVVSRTDFSITVSFAANFTTGQIVAYGIFGSCGAGPAATMTVNGTTGTIPGAAGTISGTITVNPGQNGVPYSIPAISGATSYQWVLPLGVSIASGANTNSVSLNFSSSFAGGTISVTGSNGTCSGAPSSLVIPSSTCGALLPGAINGNSSVCPGQTGVVYSIPAISGATDYTWTFPNGAGQTTTGPSVTVNFPANAASGTLSVYARSSSCPQGPTATKSIVVVPHISISDPGPICAGSTSAGFTASVMNGSEYKWYKNDILATDNGPGVPAYAYAPTTALVAGDRIKVTARITNGCVTNTVVTSNVVTITTRARTTPYISLNTTPSLPLSSCSGSNITFTGTPGGSDYTLSNFQWKLNNVPVGTTANSYATTTFAQGNIVTVTATASGSCLASSSASGSTQGFPITILPMPTAGISPSGNAHLCSTCTQNLTAVTGSGYAFQWHRGGVPIPEAAAINTYTASVAGAYTVKVTLNTCSKFSNPYTLTKNSAPVANAGADKNVVRPITSIPVVGSGTDSDGTIASYAWRKVSGGECTLTNNTTATLTVSDLRPGTYVFGLRVTDNFGEQSAEDQVTVSSVFPANNYNRITQTDVLVPNQTSETAIDALSITTGQRNEIVQYHDGLGNGMQTVIMQGSPLGKDVVQSITFDAFARPYRTYLPATVNETNGYYKNRTDLIDATTGNYKGAALNFYNDARPFAETEFEASPLNKATKEFGPGNDWKTNNKAVVRQLLVNNHSTTAVTLTGEKVIAWKINASGIPERATALTGYVETNGFYSSGQLVISIRKDENGNEERTYTDKEGNAVLKKTQVKTSVTSLNSTTEWALTYSVYDEKGNLRFVLQPVLSATIHGSDAYVVTTTDIDKLGFRFEYDTKKRLIRKKIPGAGWTNMVYDKLNRLVLLQDGNLKPLFQWKFTKYDAANRPVVTGVYTHTSDVDQPTMSGLISTANFFESYNGTASTHGYTNTVWPTSNLQVHEVTYYDNYRFRDDMAGAAATAYGYVTGDVTGQDAASDDVLGQVTGKKTNILESTNFLWSITYYDKTYRPLQIKTQNHKGGIDYVTNLYDFARLKETKITHAKGGSTYTTHRKYAYDHMGRTTEVQHKFQTEPFIILQKNTYNEKGQLASRKLHSRNSGSTFAQSTDYTYTIRGWIDQINNPSAPEAGDLFSLQMAYNLPSAGTAQYNGNITEFIWKSAGLDKQSYRYKYDALNRMEEAKYYNLFRPLNNGKYDEIIKNSSNNTYDLNGNILGLVRYGKTAAGTMGIVDELTYQYSNGDNLLKRLDDSRANTNFDDGFKELTEANNEFLYDNNGNLTRDDNKGTVSEYNVLNLPKRVTKGSDYIIYTYDASGKKLAQQVFGAGAKTTDYVAEYVYENDVLQFAGHDEGRIVADNAVGAPRPWEYQYFLKDHLGNIRVLFSEKKITTEHYGTLEDDRAADETVRFRNYSRNGFPLYNHTVGAGYTYSQLLNGGNNSQIGLAKSLEVNVGDVIDLEAYAKYEGETSNPGSPSSLLTSLISAFSLGSGGTPLESVAARTAFNNLFPGGLPWITSSKWESDVAPKAYLNYILFDQNFNFVDFGFDQISVDAKQVGATPVISHDYLNLHVTVQQKGYIYIYLSNESPLQTNVYFDDLKIAHNTGVVQITNYYAFGLRQKSNGLENAIGPRNSFNFNGKEEQDELNLSMLDFGARFYMPDIGRWSAMDPYADDYHAYSPYNYCLNRPLTVTDPNGKNVYLLMPDGTMILALLTDTDHEFYRYNEDGSLTKLDHISKDRTEIGMYLSENEDVMKTLNTGLSGEYVGSKGNTYRDYQRLVSMLEGTAAKDAILEFVVDCFSGAGLWDDVGKLFWKKAAATKAVQMTIKAVGQVHHILSNKIVRELSKHPVLKGIFQREDANWMFKALNEAAHKGYQKWHREYDDMVVDWLKTHPEAKRQDFVDYINKLYQGETKFSDGSLLKDRIPNVIVE